MLVLGAGETVLGQTDRFAPDAACRGVYRLIGEPALRRAG